MFVRVTKQYDALWHNDSKEKHILWSQMDHHQYMEYDYMTKLKIYEAEKEAAENPVMFWPIQMRRSVPIINRQEDFAF